MCRSDTSSNDTQLLTKTPDRRVVFCCSHVKRVANIVRKHRPAIRILVWDDVIRGDQFVMNEKLVRRTTFLRGTANERTIDFISAQ